MIINTLRKTNFVKKILNFIFYLRYLILIFIISIILLLTIPKLFKYVNKISELNKILKNQHGFIIKDMDEIKYNIFPLPNLEMKNAIISIDEQFLNLKVKNLKIFINFKSIYVPDEIFLKKIKFSGNFLGENINGYYIPKSKVNFLYLQIKNLGFESKIYLNNKIKLPKSSGSMKLKILDDNLLINYDYDQNFKFRDSVYKNKDIYANLRGYFDLNPFFYFNMFVDIKKINIKNLKFTKIYKILIEEISRNKLNGEVFITHKTKKIIKESISENNKLNMIFKNGDIILKNSTFNFAGFKTKLNFYLKRYTTYKELEYELFLETDNINKFFKIISFRKDNKMKEIKADITGKINLDAQKYYFDNVTINKKKIEEKNLVKLKDYFDKNFVNYFNKEFKVKNIYIFFKDLFEFI